MKNNDVLMAIVSGDYVAEWFTNSDCAVIVGGVHVATYSRVFDRYDYDEIVDFEVDLAGCDASLISRATTEIRTR